MSESTPDERRRAAEWLRQRALRHRQEAKEAVVFWQRRRLLDAADQFESAADAYEKGEQS